MDMIHRYGFSTEFDENRWKNKNDATILPLACIFTLMRSLCSAHEAEKKACPVLSVYNLSRPPEDISFSLKQSNRSPRLPWSVKYFLIKTRRLPNRKSKQKNLAT